ncbi:MAG: PilN domain-containing protein [Candidatus Saccharimonadales bacterium]
MIQFNLLPDVKMAFIRAQRIKRLVIFVSVAVAIVVLVIFIILIVYVDIIQKNHLSYLNHNIKSNQSQLGRTNDLNKILTVQNQLGALPSIDAQKPVATRLFNDMAKVTPVAANISSLNADFQNNTLEIQGNANDLKTVNQYVDTLKSTTYGKTKSSAFSNVVLSSFGLQTGKGANYKIDLDFDRAIFDTSKSGQLTVPNKIASNSIAQRPTLLFKKQPKIQQGQPSSGGNQ